MSLYQARVSFPRFQCRRLYGAALAATRGDENPFHKTEFVTPLPGYVTPPF